MSNTTRHSCNYIIYQNQQKVKILNNRNYSIKKKKIINTIIKVLLTLQKKHLPCCIIIMWVIHQVFRMFRLGAFIIMLAVVLNVSVVVCCSVVHSQTTDVTIVCMVSVAALRITSPLRVDLRW